MKTRAECAVATQHLRGLVRAEERRQKRQVNLIASENYTPQRVLGFLASKLSNKYAEGYADSRYYAGTGIVNEVEQVAIDNAKALFKANDFDVNVQALSGSPANMAVYNAFLQPGDTILSLKLTSGGHLSHGASTSLVSKIYRVKHYGLGPDEEINLDEIDGIIRTRAETGHPVRMLVAGYSSYCRDIPYAVLRQICDAHGVHLHVDFSHTAGLVAAGLLQSPFPHAHSLMCTTHKTLRGPRGAIIFSHDGQKVNKAVFPGLQGGPHMNNIAGIAATLIEAQGEPYRRYQARVVKNRAALEKCFAKRNLFQGGSDNHMLVVKNIGDGSVVEKALEEQGIIVNRQNMGQGRHGIRMGTPFVTSQGLGERAMARIGRRVCRTIERIEGADWNKL